MTNTLWIVWLVVTVFLFGADFGQKKQAGCPEKTMNVLRLMMWPAAIVVLSWNGTLLDEERRQPKSAEELCR